MRGYKTDQSLREALEDYIQATPEEGTADIMPHERIMLANVLKMRDMCVVNVMIPRADIVAIDASLSQTDLMALLAERQYSRFPVFRETLDEVVGTLHIKDILGQMARGEVFNLSPLIREVPVVSPSLPVIDLILQMRETRKHMVMVVDEYGGIDGLVTIGDVIETIFGQIGDEYDSPDAPELLSRPDGSVLIDARVSLLQFEQTYGPCFSEDDKDNSDTIGGLVCALAGRVPGRGELIRYPDRDDLTFEILDADHRRIYRLRLKQAPTPQPVDEE